MTDYAPSKLVDLTKMAEHFGARIVDAMIRSWEALNKDQRDQMRKWTRLQIVMLDCEEERMRRKFALLTSYRQGKLERDDYGPITTRTRKL